MDDDRTGVSDPRKLNLGDAMILIVAFAIGLAIAIRPLSDLGEWYAATPPSRRMDVSSWWKALARKSGMQFLLIQGSFQLLSCFLIPLTPALMVIRLRRPRPLWSRLACQPGFVGCAALCLTAIISSEAAFLDLVSIPPLLGVILPGGSVFASWLVLLSTGRWHPEAGWIDHAGRIVGGSWLATLPVMAWTST